MPSFFAVMFTYIVMYFSSVTENMSCVASFKMPSRKCSNMTNSLNLLQAASFFIQVMYSCFVRFGIL